MTDRCVRGGQPAMLQFREPRAGSTMKYKIFKSADDWRRQLDPDQYRITREKGTEPAFSGAYWDSKENGVYRCVCCGDALFGSSTKFDSGTGWPSFSSPHHGDGVVTKSDSSLGMTRVEVMCADCGAHLGHVFPDGPGPEGLRYCINSGSLNLDSEQHE